MSLAHARAPEGVLRGLSCALSYLSRIRRPQDQSGNVLDTLCEGLYMLLWDLAGPDRIEGMLRLFCAVCETSQACVLMGVSLFPPGPFAHVATLTLLEQRKYLYASH
jgi:hypothetical protein